AHLSHAEVDLLFGGPPCQGYSQIGTRSLEDPRNELYLQYIRLLKLLRPRTFLMENVPNMLLMAGGRFKREVLEALAAAGYSDCGVRLVSADDYGVPQVRRRAIFFGVRDDVRTEESVGVLFTEFLKEEENLAPTAWMAIKDLPEQTAIHYEDVAYPRSRIKSTFLDEMRLDREGAWYSRDEKIAAHGKPRRALSNHHTKDIHARRKELIALLKPGAKGDSLPKDVWNGLRPEKWRRLPVDRPAYTILAQIDRKSTRLNSSHVSISYAVFCLKKKMRTRRSAAPGLGGASLGRALGHGEGRHAAGPGGREDRGGAGGQSRGRQRWPSRGRA